MRQNQSRADSNPQKAAKVVEFSEQSAVERNCKLIDSYIVEAWAEPSPERPRAA